MAEAQFLRQLLTRLRMLLEGYSVPCGGAEITFMDAVTADCIIIFSLLKVIVISVKRKKNGHTMLRTWGSHRRWCERRIKTV